MYVKRNYGFWMTFSWSSKPFVFGLIYSLALCVLQYFLDITLHLPWQPISIIGIAVAFYLGFKNNSSYDRTWEARKIWGSIVNNSRSFASSVLSFVRGENEKATQQKLIYYHLAWLITLRHQLRLSKEWEHIKDRLSIYSPQVCNDYDAMWKHDLGKYLSAQQLEEYSKYSNRATQILNLLNQELQLAYEQNLINDFKHVELQKLIVSFYADQGKSERIKTFPFPRQYASTALWLTMVFCALLPFGMIDIFKSVNSWMFWLCPIISSLIIWTFFLMEKIGDYSENPFEGTYNDVPITAISRTIEIDLLEMLGENNIPTPTPAENGFLL